ncbi:MULTISPECIES: DUF2933 domain-containing protein [Halomonadaceae]|uniref:DUF2933 domain-containing protein n=1 Tax=Chromohalobacter canadensis TaxID=141389 RepID=A0ABZ0Y6X2_9GAMM|nr:MULTISPECIES: DUF2933 domain-containing protein [Halomonadaceae]NVN55260.1 DUF2933 domain-containing protein [bacterium Scap17]MCK0770072.1 DUF2933 domain-containing protein [Chromohalobacter canadensis]MCO7234113.1 DUF2933 domain-containing protein [Cobetia sp. Dlab-2-AX]MCO7237398.1 DUF2933 domain-containing protein [Cobetia sp. Dlab-2-U]QFT84154.1 hypothetical protein FIU88_04100 [Halomonas sp. THAF12]
MEKRAQRRLMMVWLPLGGILAVGGYLLVTGQRLHPYQALPLLLLACPLMHLFLHRHHGGQQDHGDDD